MSAVAAYSEFALLSARYLAGRSENGAEKFADLATTAHFDGHEKLAVRSMRRATDLSPQNARLFASRGGLEYELGKLEQARQSFAKALGLDPELPDALFGMAASLHASGRPSDAIFYYLVYLRERTEDVRAMIYLAGAYQATGQPAEAVELFERALSLSPGNPEVHGLYGRTLYELGRIDEARTHLLRATELGSTDSDVHRVLGLTQMAAGQVEAGRDELERAVKSDPSSVAARIELATKLIDDGRAEEALEHARRAADLAVAGDLPEYEKVAAFWLLGWTHYVLADWRKSAKASGKALDIDPSVVAVRFNLGLALLHGGHVEDAWNEYRGAAEAVDDAWDLRVTGMEDLRAAVNARPDLPEGAEILAFLEKRYEELNARRSSPAST